MKTIHNIKTKVQILLFAFITGFAFVACQEKNGSLGMDIIPPNEQITVVSITDKTSSDSYYEKDSPIRVDEPSGVILGTLNDPVFGQTTGAIATQLRLISKPEVNGTSKLDSAVLLVAYRSVYGDTLTPQTFTVKELNSDLFKDKAYMSSFDVSSLASDNIIGTGTLKPHLSIKTDKDTLTQVLRIPVSADYANKVLSLWDKKTDDGHLVFDDNKYLIQELKGIYIEPQAIPGNRKGALIKTNKKYTTKVGSSSYTVDLRTRMIIYAKTEVSDDSTDDPNDTKTVQKTISLYSTEYSATVPKMTHDYSGTALEQELGNDRSTSKHLFVQPNEGIRSVVKLNKLDELKKLWTANGWINTKEDENEDKENNTNNEDKIFINKARLNLYVDTLASDHKTLALPSTITLRYNSKDSEDGDLRDSENGKYIAGTFDKTIGAYVFNLTNYVSDYMHDKEDNNNLYVIPYYRVSSTERAVLFSNDSEKGIELEILYTKKGNLESTK